MKSLRGGIFFERPRRRAAILSFRFKANFRFGAGTFKNRGAVSRGNFARKTRGKNQRRSENKSLAVKLRCMDTVTVNGQPTIRAGTNFSAEIILNKKINEITAVSQGSFGNQQHTIKVVWDRNSFKRYRFGIDDNSFFLRDIFSEKL